MGAESCHVCVYRMVSDAQTFSLRAKQSTWNKSSMCAESCCVYSECGSEPLRRDAQAFGLRKHSPSGTRAPCVLSFLVCVLRMWVRASQKRRTSIQPEGKTATWNETFMLPVHMAKTQQLELTLYDHDKMSADDELGRYTTTTCCFCTLPCAALLSDTAA